MVNLNYEHQRVYQLANSNHQLADKLKISLSIIEQAFLDFGIDSVTLSFNGGKDCTVLLHLFQAVKAKLCRNEEDEIVMDPSTTLYVRSQNPFPEIDNFVKLMAEAYDVDVFMTPSSMRLGLQQFLDSYPKVTAILIGTRRTDPFSENLQPFDMTTEGWPKLMRVHPILDWDYSDVWTFLLELDVPYCPLYDRGYTSLGDQNNTKPNPLLKNKTTNYGYDPAYKLKDGSMERCGRAKKSLN